MSVDVQLTTCAERSLNVLRPPHIAQRIVFVDGLPGCGKTLFSAIVSAMDRVELEKYNYQLEYVCQAHFLGRMSEDAAVALARLYTDVDLYNVMTSREVNFRVRDLSGVFNTARPWRYLRRLFLPDGDMVLQRIQQERPIVNLVTHSLLPVCRPIAMGLGDRFRIVEVVRHPLYMLKAWFLYIDRYAKDPRDFTMCLGTSGQPVPWFALGWEERYWRCRPMDRVIYSIERLLHWGEETLACLSAAQRRQVLVIPFEPFVLQPWPYVRQLEQVLGSAVTSCTRRELKRQRVPRAHIAAGLDLQVYRDNGWEPARKGLTEVDELRSRRQFAAEHASAEAMEVLDRLSAVYEATYLAGRHESVS